MDEQPNNPQPVVQQQPTVPPQVDPAYNPSSSESFNSNQIRTGQAFSTNHHLRLILSLVFGALVVVCVIVFLVIKLFFGSQATINYDNGIGSKFQLTFYKSYKTSKAVDAGFADSANDPKLVELISNKGINGKAPLTLFIESNTDENNPVYSMDCKQSSLTQAFTAHNDYINQDVPICIIRTGASQSALIYIATFHDAHKSYLVFFSQDVYNQLKQATGSQQKLQQVLASIDITVYKNDVQSIFKSIKPL